MPQGGRALKCPKLTRRLLRHGEENTSPWRSGRPEEKRRVIASLGQATEPLSRQQIDQIPSLS
jgi:hypothetical protein